MSLIAPITNISRCSLHDGPGVRTVVYFKGCTMECKWCHNPETISFDKEILYIDSKCIGCAKCVEVCPDCHVVVDDEPVLLRDKCRKCGKCAQVCPTLALSVCGEDKTTDEVFDEIKKDVHYYVSSGGGVTFSGGECLMRVDFLEELMKKCKEANIHTAIESAFCVPWQNVEQILPYTDLFFADLKIADSQKHQLYTGRTNELITENIQKLSHRFDNIILRIPIIPGINDSAEDIEGFAKIIKTFGNGVKSVELLKYNNLAESKYRFAGRDYTTFAESAQSNEEMQNLCDMLSSKSGMTVFSQ